MNKPIKPNITIPASFADNGVKVDFDNDLLIEGFSNLNPDVLAGDNLNKFIDDTYKGLNYGMAAADAINLINEGETLTVVDGKLTSGASGAGLEIGDIGIAPLGIDESLGKRRYLNGSILVQEQYPYFTQRVKTAIQTYTGLGCTEEEWQTISNMSVGGQCGKFVVDDTAGTIRLPKIIMPIQGLTNLTNLGEIVSAGLPNITGVSNGICTAGVANGSDVSGCIYNIPYNTGQGAAGNNDWDTKFGIDASLSNPIYGNSNTVQQEQIQYPYFIQVATGSSYQENITNEIELNNPFVLLEGQYFIAPVYNSSWLQSNASFTGSLALHPSAYNALLVEQNPNVEVGTTVDNYTKRGLSVKLDTEAYTDYDFVLNTTSQTFRCPLKLSGTSDEGLYLYFYVGETVQNANLVNVGRVEEKISNIIPDNSSVIASYAMPSDRYIDLTLGASGSTYTAPANGYFAARLQTSSASAAYFGLWYEDGSFGTSGWYTAGSCNITKFIPVKRGQKIILEYTNFKKVDNSMIRFFYAEGEV